MVSHGQELLAIELDTGTAFDDEELTQLTGRLRNELLELDVAEVKMPVAGDAPAGAKGLELLALGGLVVKFVLREDVLRSIVDTVRGWLTRQSAGTVSLSLQGDACTVTGRMTPDQQKLLDLWIARHAATG